MSVRTAALSLLADLDEHLRRLQEDVDMAHLVETAGLDVRHTSSGYRCGLEHAASAERCLTEIVLVLGMLP